MLGLWGFLLYALGPALPALREQLDVSRAVVSLHTTLIAVGAIAVGIAGDRFVVRLGRRAAFWTAAGGIASGALLLAAGGTLAVTLPAAALLGIAGALVVATLQATLADRHGPLAPVALVESNAIATGLGVLALFAVAVAIWAGSDWRAVFIAAALLAVPAMAIAYGSVCFPAAPELPARPRAGIAAPVLVLLVRAPALRRDRVLRRLLEHRLPRVRARPLGLRCCGGIECVPDRYDRRVAHSGAR